MGDGVEEGVVIGDGVIVMIGEGVGVRMMNCTPFVRRYGILLTSGVLLYAKRDSKQEIHG